MYSIVQVEEIQLKFKSKKSKENKLSEGTGYRSLE